MKPECEKSTGEKIKDTLKKVGTVYATLATQSRILHWILLSDAKIYGIKQYILIFLIL